MGGVKVQTHPIRVKLKKLSYIRDFERIDSGDRSQSSRGVEQGRVSVGVVSA